MPRLSSVTVALTANTAKFASGMQRANKHLKGFQRSTNKTKAALTGLVGVGGSLAFTGLIKSTIDAGDNIDKLTKRIGGSAEFFSRMEHAAKLSGVQFNQFTMGVQRMTRRLAEAGQGTGEAKKAIEELGLSGKKLSQLGLEDQFYAVADALKTVENPADRVRLAMKFFDSEGVSLLQMMGDGAAGLAEMAREADALGITIDNKTAQAMAHANDELTRTMGVFKGISTQIATVVAPLMGEVASRFAKASIESKGFSDQITSGMKGSAMVIGVLADGIRGIHVVLKLAELGALGAVRGMFGFLELVDVVFKPVGSAIETYIIGGLKKVLQIGAKFSTTFQSALNVVEGFSLPDTLVSESSINAINDRIESVVTSLKKLALEDLPSDVIQGKINEIIDAAQIRVDQAREQLKSEPLVVPVEIEGGDDGKAAFDKLFGANSLENLFSDFDNIEENFANLMAKLIAEATAASIVQSIFGSGTSTQNQGWGQIIAGAFGGTRATGGPVAGGSAYMVGETGPELFVPNTAGRIIPNAERGDMGHQGGGETNIHFHGVTDADSFRRSQTQIGAQTAVGIRKAQRNL